MGKRCLKVGKRWVRYGLKRVREWVNVLKWVRERVRDGLKRVRDGVEMG